jgi:rhodanese-related sulfurtransferase
MQLAKTHAASLRAECYSKRKQQIQQHGFSIGLLVRHRRLLWRRLMRFELKVFNLDTSQIILYVIIGVLLFLYIRRMLLLRSLKSYSPIEVAEKMKINNVVLLDVRTAGERQSNSIKGSVHIPLHDLRRRSNELEKYKNREIVCYCASGNRSVSATATLNKLGFNAANMKGGIAEWNFSGLR